MKRVLVPEPEEVAGLIFDSDDEVRLVFKYLTLLKTVSPVSAKKLSFSL